MCRAEALRNMSCGEDEDEDEDEDEEEESRLSDDDSTVQQAGSAAENSGSPIDQQHMDEVLRTLGRHQNLNPDPQISLNHANLTS